MWRRASVIALLKPGKLETSPNINRPNSRLCTTFKLTERLILNRINPIVEKFLPHEQAGFRGGRSTADQVVCLAQNIEQAFDDTNVCGAIFLDLTAAYDTVWHLSLHLKLLKVLACQRMVSVVMKLPYSRSFVLYTSDGQTSPPSEPKTESYKDLFSPLVCTTSTQQIFRKRRPSGTCTLMMSLWPSRPHT